VISDVGTRTDVISLGSVGYQPILAGVDNTGTGAQADQLAPWRNGGVGGNTIAGSLLTAAEGESPAALANGYGRLVYGAESTSTTNGNVIATFRHGGDAPLGFAPLGQRMRVAGNTATNWPLSPCWPPPGVNPSQLTTLMLTSARGIQSGQHANVNAITGMTNTFWQRGTQNLVIFRGALTLSDDARARTVVLGTTERSFDRDAGQPCPIDTSFARWQNGAFDLGPIKADVRVVPATMHVGGVCNDLDFNNDGVTPDIGDVLSFFNAFGDDDCPECDPVDFNADAVYPDLEDVAAYLRRFAGEPC
jgi:hypothetical protein